jgi:hypothetical protein
MPSWALGVVGASALSLLLACAFLRMRCRGVGPPFGRRAKYWALFIVLSTTVVAAGAGTAILAASHGAAYVGAFVGIIVPGGLWLTRLPPQRDRDMLPRTWFGVLAVPFSRLYERMGDDMESWCQIRLAAAKPRPQWIADAAEYYWNQMSRVTDGRVRADLDRWRDSIAHKADVVRLIDLDASPGRLRAALQAHPSTQNTRKYDEADPPRLARRLETEALNELHLFLTHAYQLGYHKMLIYPFRPSAHRPQAQRAEL